MTWLTPLVAGIAAAIAIPSLLLLYFLKLRRRDVEISTTLLWRKSIEDLRANAPFQKLRRNILLLLQLLVLGAGLLAVAQPEIRAGAPVGGRSILLIDRSGSMGAGEDGRTRLELAKERALEFVEEMEEGGFLSRRSASEAMVIAFDTSAEVVMPFTSDKGRLRSAIESIEQTDAPTSIEDALQLAGGHARPTVGEGEQVIPGAPMFLFSDGSIPDLDRVDLPGGATIEYRPVGEGAPENIAITSMRADRSFERRSAASVFVSLQNTAGEAREVDVQLAVNGVVAAVRKVTLDAADEAGPGVGGVVFELDRSDSAVLVAQALVDDALEADDTARLVLPPAKRLSVAIVGSDSLYLRAALEGMPLSELAMLSTDEFRSLAERLETDRYDVYVLNGWVPEPADALDPEAPEPDAEPGLPPGRYLVLGAVPEMRGLGVASEEPAAESSVMIDWERAHSALRFAGLERVVFVDPIEMQASSAVRTIAHATHGPAIVEAAQGSVRAIVCGFDPAASNWPFDVGFVLFLASSVRYLGDEAGDLDASDLRPGETLVTRLPPGARDVRLILPDETTRTLVPGPDGTVTYGPIRRAGLYQLRWRGEPGPRDSRVGDGMALRVLPVNMTDAEESRLAATDAITLATGQVAGVPSGKAGRETVRLWPWLVVCAIGLLMVEWWVYNRKVHI